MAKPKYELLQNLAGVWKWKCLLCKDAVGGQPSKKAAKWQVHFHMLKEHGIDYAN